MKKLVLLFVLMMTGFAQAQPAPSFYPGCVYQTAQITLSNLQTSAWPCDINGKLITTGSSGSTVSPGGANTNVQFNDSGVFGGSSLFTFVKASGLVSSSSLSLGGATIGSNALAVTGQAQFNSAVRVAAGSTAVPAFIIGTSTTDGWFAAGGGQFTWVTGGTAKQNFIVSQFRQSSDSSIRWGNNVDVTMGSQDVSISRSGVNIAQIGDGGTNANGTLDLAALVMTAVAPTVSVSQIALGATTAANTNCGGIATACIVINVAGTTRYLPYF